jgi:hypothetical protein
MALYFLDEAAEETKVNRRHLLYFEQENRKEHLIELSISWFVGHRSTGQGVALWYAAFQREESRRPCFTRFLILI